MNTRLTFEQETQITLAYPFLTDFIERSTPRKISTEWKRSIPEMKDAVDERSSPNGHVSFNPDNNGMPGRPDVVSMKSQDAVTNRA